jgi:hypothetical protein
MPEDILLSTDGHARVAERACDLGWPDAIPFLFAEACDCEGRLVIPISASLLKERLPEALKLMEKSAETAAPDRAPLLEQQQETLSEFVALCDRMERLYHKPVGICIG